MYEIESTDKNLHENSNSMKCLIQDLKLVEDNQTQLEQQLTTNQFEIDQSEKQILKDEKEKIILVEEL